MATIQSNQTIDAIQQAHEQFSEALRQQAEQIDRLRQGLESLLNEQQQLEEIASRVVEPLTRSFAADGASSALSPSAILACVRKLSAATDIEQVFESLAEEAANINVRAAVLGIRGHAAWGTSSGGFGPALSGKDLRTLVVPLNQDGPFRQVFETAAAVEVRAIDLMKNPNVLLKFAPASKARVVLLPVRSAGSVTAILYAEAGEKRDSGLIDSLKVLAEFAGAQIDRLTVVHGGLAAAETTPAGEEAGRSSEQAAGDEIRAAEQETTYGAEIPKVMTPEPISAETSAPPSEAPPISPPVSVFADPTPAPASEAVPASAEPPAVRQPADEPQAAAEIPGGTLSPEEEEKVHRDARRFAKLLVSEIELYNKSSVEEGRRNKDLYHRLKKDIDRSRETYEKRFAHTVASKVDYFHEELIRTLAETDPVLLGPGYPGPSV